MFLSDTEISDLTGHKTKKAQKAWLVENHFQYWESASGKIVVPKAKTEKRTSAVRYSTRIAMDIDSAIETAEEFNTKEIGVYLLIDGGKVVYVGKSKSVFLRVGQHTADKNFDSFKLIRLAEEDLDLWERELIAALQPKYNKLIVDVPQPTRSGVQTTEI
jgi:hypothetical protein